MTSVGLRRSLASRCADRHRRTRIDAIWRALPVAGLRRARAFVGGQGRRRDGRARCGADDLRAHRRTGGIEQHPIRRDGDDSSRHEAAAHEGNRPPVTGPRLFGPERIS